MRFRSTQLPQLFWLRLLNIWNITNETRVSYSHFLFETILQKLNIELLTYELMMLLSSKVQEIVTPFTSMRIHDFVQEECALMVDVDQNALFELHAMVDYLGIQPLLKLTSLAVLLHYMWVGVYISNFEWNCDKLQLNSPFIT